MDIITIEEKEKNRRAGYGERSQATTACVILSAHNNSATSAHYVKCRHNRSRQKIVAFLCVYHPPRLQSAPPFPVQLLKPIQDERIKPFQFFKLLRHRSQTVSFDYQNAKHLHAQLSSTTSDYINWKLNSLHASSGSLNLR